VQQLTDILLYHVLGSVVTSSDLSDGLTATTLQGSTVTIMVTGGVRINDANVIVADVEASNGIVHVIDAVLLPDVDLPSIVEIAAADDTFSTLVAAVSAADLVDTLSGEGTFTVFAPTNDAFADLPDGTLDTLLQPENVQQLTDILLYHVLGSVVTSSDLSDGLTATTLQGSTVTIMVTGGVRINDANVIVADVEASNGIVHVIDAVLLPPSEPASEQGDGRPPSPDTQVSDTVVAGSQSSGSDIMHKPMIVVAVIGGSLVLLISLLIFCYCRTSRLRALGKVESYGHQAVPMEDEFEETENLWTE